MNACSFLNSIDKRVNARHLTSAEAIREINRRGLGNQFHQARKAEAQFLRNLDQNVRDASWAFTGLPGGSKL